jgi:hypothetical protein
VACIAQDRGVEAVTVAKTYRMLKAIMATAVDDLIARSSCRLRNAGVEQTPDHKPRSIAAVEAVAAAIETRYRVLVLHGAWSGCAGASSPD